MPRIENLEFYHDQSVEPTGELSIQYREALDRVETAYYEYVNALTTLRETERSLPNAVEGASVEKPVDIFRSSPDMFVPLGSEYQLAAQGATFLGHLAIDAGKKSISAGLEKVRNLGYLDQEDRVSLRNTSLYLTLCMLGGTYWNSTAVPGSEIGPYLAAFIGVIQAFIAREAINLGDKIKNNLS